MPKTKIGIILISILLITTIYVKRDDILSFIKPSSPKSGPSVETSEIYNGVSYEAVNKNLYNVSVLAENLLSPTRIKMTPDGKHLLVTQITGELMGLDREANGWSKPYLVTAVDTKFPGFPPDEAGLTGVVIARDYPVSGKVFLLYAYQDKKEKVQNRVSTTTLSSKEGKLAGSKPKLVFQANIEGHSSHQITDGISVEIGGESRLAFLIGEGFDAKRAQDVNLHAGKLMSVKEDGSNPTIHAMGIRNGYALVANPFDKEGKILISDTGPDKYDRLVYTNPFLKGPINLGWDGDQEKLAYPIPDPNFPKVKDVVIFRYPETRTFTGLAFQKDGTLLVTLFGKTGYKDNSPGKEILLGKITNLTNQPSISMAPIIRRAKEANGKMGNPLGMETDPATGDFFFMDVIEGRIYQVRNSGTGVNNR